MRCRLHHLWAIDSCTHPEVPVSLIGQKNWNSNIFFMAKRSQLIHATCIDTAPCNKFWAF
jgi:hypothetical protein